MRQRLFIILVAALLAAPVSAQQLPTNDQQTVDSIQHALVRLPYYGVFDYLAFRYDKGTVTLSGYAYAAGLKRDAVNAVKGIPRVDKVVDQIEQLPASQNDDRIRWRTFYRIYNDSVLSRYAPGGGFSARFDRAFSPTRYPGTQPFGDYPIHIVVDRGRTQLLGVVDTDADKTIAGFRAREVPGTFGVENQLAIPPRTTR
jgi:hyperosmotically inducible periplasmic protein